MGRTGTRTGIVGAMAVAAMGLGTLAGGAAHAAAPGHAPATVKAAAATRAPCTLKRIRACVSLSRQRAWLMRDGKVVYGPVRVASGRPGYRTSSGMFRVTFKDLHHRSHEYGGAPMPYSVFFHGGQAFHEGDVGVMSHGCVHLSHYSARRFYNYLHKGDYVRVR
jgi:hypothetical protein